MALPLGCASETCSELIVPLNIVECGNAREGQVIKARAVLELSDKLNEQNKMFTTEIKLIVAPNLF